ncbi:DEAD/DEAH box helicase [Halosquirtibacter xylanolyticus]|uniref:DEAD/DEAH box helicase n=1 Tax=Halosquirtibacter xylanolyticus TaxID=3374599 RepID=UPI003749EEA7|nr:DEAD/DEAH box helicase [Prolixibacteraceae bacterium]
MKNKFILLLQEHRVLGLLLKPCLITQRQGAPFYTIVKPIRSHNFKDDDYSFNALEKRIVKHTESYSDENLAKKFRQKGGLQQLYNRMSQQDFLERVEPYIDLNLTSCLRLMKENGTKLYFSKGQKYNNIYDEDEIFIHTEGNHATFLFDKERDHIKYSLSLECSGRKITLPHRMLKVLTNHPCTLFIGHNIYLFDELQGTRLKPFLTQNSVTVPLSIEDKYFTTFVLSTIKRYPVEGRGFDIEHIHELPKLWFEAEHVDEENVKVKIFFALHDHTASLSKHESIVSYKKERGRYCFIKSDFPEPEYRHLLAFLESQNIVIENDYILLNQSKYYSTSSFIELLHLIEDSDITFDITHQFVASSNQYFIGKRELEFTVQQDDDWFDLKGIVTFGSYQFPFTHLKNHILNNIQEFELPNGQIALIPQEWFTKFKEIFSLATTDEENIKLRKSHFPLIDPLYLKEKQKIKHKLQKLSNQVIEVAVPTSINATLRNYQEEGFHWMNYLNKNQFGGCLADDMGLGKTLQCITLLAFLKDHPEHVTKDTLPTSLIILPTSLVYNWENEIRKFCPTLSSFKYIGTHRPKEERLSQIINETDVILTTYGTIRNDYESLKHYRFNYIILDEGQNIKNPHSKTYKAINELNSQHRLSITGTPIENSLHDLWAQLNFLNRGLLGTEGWFKKTFISPIEKKQDEEAQKKLLKLIQPFILRRTKEEVATDLPALSEQTRFVRMSEEQHKGYEKEKSAIRNAILDEEMGSSKGEKQTPLVVLQGLMTLRQWANHPRMIQEDNTLNSGKFEEVMRMLRILRTEKHKILVFSSFVKHLNLFEQEFHKEDWKYAILTGQTSQRQEIIEKFQQDDETNIFLISLKAGGVGLNLTEADYVFILDPWWNPAAELQAINRAHRIGQTKNVFVYRFISEGTIEEKIQKLKDKKSQLAEKFIQSNNPITGFTSNELLSLIDAL